MKILTSDINLGGSTLQFLTWGKRNLSKIEFIRSIELNLKFKAKTKPTRIARRLASLVGVTYDLLKGDDYTLDCIIEAFNRVEKEMNK